MFSSNSKEVQKPSRNIERNILAANTIFVGDIKSDGDFRIDGTLEGKLKTKGRVIIGVSGNIKGDIESTNADIEGTFSGKLYVAEVLTLKGTAHVSGEAVIGNLLSEPGAIFNASCSMKGAIKELNKNDEKRRSGKTA
ncbi:MAG: bactofilin family protein [Flavobacteriaceae bacterium]